MAVIYVLDSLADGQIAAITAARSLTLVTRNLRDFADYPGLNVESWWSHGPS